jgi:Arc/MetJ-type ribon-helix-helix transcriptional regulator
MKRTTISLPNDVAAALEREAARRRVSVSQVAREAIEARLGRSKADRRRLPFASLGRSGHTTTSLDVEDLLKAAWSDDRDR